MGRRRPPGLIKRGDTWHIDKHVKGYGRICESTGSSRFKEAQSILTHRLEEIRRATVFGIRPTRTFREAATKYLTENLHKRSIGRDALDLRTIEPFIGALPLIVMLLVFITSPDYISLLWTERLGPMMLAGSALWMTAGLLVMRKMITFNI